MPALPPRQPPSPAALLRPIATRLRAGLRWLGWLGLVAGSLLPAQAQTPAPAPAASSPVAAAAALAPAELPPAEQGLLWRVQAAEGQGAPSFLYGTLHIDDRRLIARLDQLPPLRDALDGARLLMLELLPSADDARAFQQATQLPAGESLQALTGPALGQTVIGLLRDRYGIPPEADRRLIARLDQLPPLRDALDGARLLMLELLPSADDARAFQQATQLPAGESLQALTGPALGQTVIGLLRDRYGIPPEAASRFKPWAAYLFLNQPARPIGEILDRAILARAQRAGRPLAALETLDQQLGALDGLPMPQQLKLLESVALRHDRTQAAIEGLIQLYLEEDLNGLADLQQPGPRDDAELAAAHAALVERLVTQRNHGMVRNLAAELKTGGVFVAVGALHLWGDQGLPALLAREGWSVQRVR